jgi:hypothetical protein
LNSNRRADSGLLHLIGGLIQLPAQFLHLRIAAFARQPLELTRRAPRFVDQLLLLSLISATGSVTGLTLHPTALFFEGLFLPSRQFFQFAFSFRFLFLRLLLLLPLHRLVLVHLTEFNSNKPAVPPRWLLPPPPPLAF